MATDPHVIERHGPGLTPPAAYRSPTRRSRRRAPSLRRDRTALDILPHQEFRLDDRAVSLLDEAHRRIKDNVQAIERRLRLGPGEEGQPTTEALLSGFQHQLQSQADLQRTRCRAGSFEQVDLAVYLRQVASALSAASGRSLGGPPGGGGWALDPIENRLCWIDDDCEVHPLEPRLGDLHEVLRLVPRASRAAIHRAVCAATMLAPPSLLKWTSSIPGQRLCDCERPGAGSTASLEVRLGEGRVRVLLNLSNRNLGLPLAFNDEEQKRLLRQLCDSLEHIYRDGDSARGGQVEFEVRFRSQ